MEVEGRMRKVCNIVDAPGYLSLRSEKYHGMKVKLTRNEVDTAERQLGVCLTVSGKDEDEYLYIIDQSEILAGKVKSLPFNRRDVEIISLLTVMFQFYKILRVEWSINMIRIILLVGES